jgi:long-chain acyl-CoA synthetase
MIEFDPVLVHDWLTRSARRFPAKTALVCGRERWTYEAVERSANRLASALGNAGVARGDRAVVFMDTCCEAVVSIYGILKAGGAFVVVGGTAKTGKLQHILRDSGAKAVIAHVDKADIVLESLKGMESTPRMIWLGDDAGLPVGLESSSISWKAALSSGTWGQGSAEPSGDPAPPHCIDADLAALVYTSGSTGRPKGVMCTHHNMVSSARSIIQYIGNEEEDVILDVLPLSFDYGLYQVIMAFMFGGTVVMENSFVYVHRILNLIAEEKVTGFPVVPTILSLLFRMKDLHRYDLCRLRYVTNTGAALSGGHILRFREMFPHVRLYSMYGLTECKRACYLPPERIDLIPSSVGRAMPNCEAEVVDENDRRLPPGETGELVIRGSNVMQGYWNDPETSGAAFRPGRYPADVRLHTGDFFRSDSEGFLCFVGRRDDMIKSGGQRVSPKEVENGIAGMPGVSEVAVIGVEDDVMGQAVKAFVVPSPGAQVTERDVLRFCREHMEPVMVPKWVEVATELPKLDSGKIDRNRLTRQAGAVP